jgi:hypothetical protein
MEGWYRGYRCALFDRLHRGLVDGLGGAKSYRNRAGRGMPKRLLVDPRSQRAIMAGMEATSWLNEELERWPRRSRPPRVDGGDDVDILGTAPTPIPADHARLRECAAHIGARRLAPVG